MISGTLRQFAPAFGDFVVNAPSQLDTAFTGVGIDSRALWHGGIFVAIKGEKHDGHDFARDAVKGGVAALIVSKSRFAEFADMKSTAVIAVDDPLTTMQQIAKVYLDQINPRRIAITGTNGKTTTKSIIASLLSAKYRTASTRGNLNNQFGVPLSIFEFDRNCEVAVFEFAMSTRGEIQRLVELYVPDIRVILNIGPAHLETLKTIDAVAEAKFEMLTNVRAGDWIVLNMDDPNIRSRSYRYKANKLTYGTLSEYDVHPDEIRMNGNGRAHLLYLGEDITIPVLGMHHVSNCLAAIAVAKLMDIPFALVKSGIETFVPGGNRMTAEEYLGVTIINDAYNSNPVSAKGALDTIASMKIAGRRVVVFGDMLELGDKAEEYHAELGRKISSANVDLLVLLGPLSPVVRDAAIKAGQGPSSIIVAADHSAAVEALSHYLKSGDLLLLKASRGIKLEIVEQGIKATLGRRN
jgi:UDP-N-acetylmuramoyl-tripeptide--D-alanyl-D-alanine ligase